MSSRPKKHNLDPAQNLHSGCDVVREDLAALALGALDSAARDTLEHHLRWCEECRAEAVAFEQVAHLLPLALPLDLKPAPSSRAALLDRITRDDDALVAASAGAMPPLPPDPEPPRSKAASGTGWMRFVPAALVAPLVLALLVVGTWANSMRNDLDNQPSTGELVIRTTLQGDELQMYNVEQTCPDCAGNGQFALSETDLMGMVVGWDFDPAEVHEVWGVTDSGERKRVCELYVDATGAVMQTFTLPEKPSGLTEIHITDASGILIYVVHIQTTAGDAPEPTALPTVIH